MTTKEIKVQLALGLLSWEDKIRLAYSKRTSKEILTILSTDENNNVSHKAGQALKEKRMKIISLDVSTALAILDALGCSDDPIMYKGKEITPQELDYHYNYDYNIKASSVRIKFYTGSSGKMSVLRLTKGSLYTMVVNRLAGR